MRPSTPLLLILIAPAAFAAPNVKMAGASLGDARWTTGFWADRFETCRLNTVPAMGRLMEGTEHGQFFENFRIAAGLAPGRHRGPKWNDGDFYKWLEAAAAVYAITHDEQLDRQLDAIIEVIAKAQRADGYLHTPVLIKQRNGEDARPFADPLDFEMYNMGHLLTAACVHYRATGKTNLLKVARGTADYLCTAFDNPTPPLARHGICPSHYMGLVELYRTTGDRRYLDLARKLIDVRDLVTDGTDDNQDRIPFRRQTQATGHAVRANYLYAGAADVYTETGDATLLEPLQKIWEDVVTRKLYITGGCGALYDGASPDASPDQKAITRVHQAYGRAFQLPNTTAHNETCAAVASVLWNWRMLRITGDARYADVLELTLYNAVLAGISLDGTRYFYTNPLRQLDPPPADLRWPRKRQALLSCFCCPPNVARTIAESAAYAYGISDAAVWVNLYGSSVIDTHLPDGTLLKLTQETNYPWDGKVRLTVTAPRAKAFSLMLRIPAWAKGASVRVNADEPLQTPPASRYCEVRRTWSPGDTVDIDLPMPARLVEANPQVEETRNQVAVMRGPLVYCLESTDLPKGVHVQDVRIPYDIDLSCHAGDSPVAPIAITGKALFSPQGDWTGRLYRDFAPIRPRGFDMKLIPYFAWGNRGQSEMTVWIPLGR